MLLPPYSNLSLLLYMLFSWGFPLPLFFHLCVWFLVSWRIFFFFFMWFTLMCCLNKLSSCIFWTSSVQFSSVAPSCPTLCNPMNRSMPGLPVHHQLLEFTQTHVHRVSDAIQPSHPLSSPSPPAPNPSQHQDLFQWVNSSHEVDKVLEFQLQHQSFQWTPRTDLLWDGLVGSLNK